MPGRVNLEWVGPAFSRRAITCSRGEFVAKYEIASGTIGAAAAFLALSGVSNDDRSRVSHRWFEITDRVTRFPFNA
jgi:hypothetical protein